MDKDLITSTIVDIIYFHLHCIMWQLLRSSLHAPIKRYNCNNLRCKLSLMLYIPCWSRFPNHIMVMEYITMDRQYPLLEHAVSWCIPWRLYSKCIVWSTLRKLHQIHCPEWINGFLEIFSYIKQPVLRRFLGMLYFHRKQHHLWYIFCKKFWSDGWWSMVRRRHIITDNWQYLTYCSVRSPVTHRQRLFNLTKALLGRPFPPPPPPPPPPPTHTHTHTHTHTRHNIANFFSLMQNWYCITNTLTLRDEAGQRIPL